MSLPAASSRRLRNGSDVPSTRVTGSFGISVHRNSLGWTVTLAGELDLAQASIVTSELRRVEDSGPDAIIVDVDALTFMDVAGMRVLLAAHQRACADGRHLALTGASGAVLRLLEIAGVRDVLDLRDDLVRSGR